MNFLKFPSFKTAKNDAHPHWKKGSVFFLFILHARLVTLRLRRFETKNRAVKQAKLLNAKWRKSKRREVTKAEFITLTRGLMNTNFSIEKPKISMIMKFP